MISVNGKPHGRTSINSEIFTTGGTLDFKLGAKPSKWGTGAEDGLPSLTRGDEVAKPLADTTRADLAKSSSGVDVSALFDNTSATEVRFETATPSVTITFRGAKKEPVFYTLTAASMAADPSSWVLEGRNNGSSWTELDARTGREFKNRRETKPFKIGNSGAYQMFRLTIRGGADKVALSEIELLAKP